MTVCIGAICDNGKSIVAVSDKMITAAPPYVEFEHDLIKLEELSNKCLALTAGSALRHIELCRSVKRKISEEESPNIASIVSTVKGEYSNLRKKKAEEIHLTPRGLTLEDFYEKKVALFPRELSFGIDNDIIKFNYGIHMLLSGVDESGAHIYRIDNPGISECFDSLGFNAIGIGQDHAVLSLIGNKYTTKMDLNEATYLVYEAKRKSEIAPGVGGETDIFVIKDEKIIELSTEKIKDIEKIYEKRIKPRKKEIIDLIKTLEIH